MTDRDAIRRELAAEIVASAEATAARHFAAMEQAREYGKDDMAQRAEHCVNAWKAVALEVRMKYLDRE